MRHASSCCRASTACTLRLPRGTPGDSHPCGDGSNNYKPWPGLACDAAGGYVTAITLRSKGLAGQLPDSFAALKTLRTIDLANNSLQGASGARRVQQGSAGQVQDRADAG
jgi:hypothetical protein